MIPSEVTSLIKDDGHELLRAEKDTVIRVGEIVAVDSEQTEDNRWDMKGYVVIEEVDGYFHLVSCSYPYEPIGCNRSEIFIDAKPERYWFSIDEIEEMSKEMSKHIVAEAKAQFARDFHFGGYRPWAKSTASLRIVK